MIAFARLKTGENVGHYMIYKFSEAHNHHLATPISRQYLPGQSRMHKGHQMYIFNNLKVNRGPTASFRMWKEHVGSYMNIGASLDDFKNFYRDLKRYIKDVDAQMFVELYLRKKETSPGFFFDSEIDDSRSLCMALWADATSRKHYSLFGDTLSVDGTYSTNKYNMIFVPFTGVDNNKKCVTFAIGLISKETKQPYTWLLETFLKAMDGKQPTSIITDQDPSLIVVVPKIFNKSIHKFCAWHIMRKLPDKVCVQLRSDENFLTRFNRLVYNSENEPPVFEAGWRQIMDDYSEYNLRENVWLKEIYDIKEMWVPAYFRDVYLGGLLRTTSRSESENNFFDFFLNNYVSLVELQMRCQSALDAQRHKMELLQSKGKLYSPPLKTPLQLEKHAAFVYTHSVFFEFQIETYSSSYDCGLDGLRKENGKDIFSVNQFSNTTLYEVVYDATTQQVDCHCKMYNRVGILCRHAIWVLNTKGICWIPKQYISERWTKEATKKPVFDNQGNLLEDCNQIDEKKRILGQVWNEVYMCVGLAEDNIEELTGVLNTLKLCSSELLSKKQKTDPLTKDQEMEQFVGFKAPEEVTIQNPKQSINKGSRKVKSRQVEEEPRIIKPRQCKTCGKIAGHNTRTCPDRPK